MLIPGTRIGDYVVETPLGSGAMAVVYRVRHTESGRRSALKVLRMLREDVERRFVREARIQALLKHPGIVSFQDMLEVGDAPGLLQELIEGPSLDRWIVEKRPSLTESLEVARSLLAAVAHAHRLGVIHRDLKPTNVLMQWVHHGWRPRITDFGIAKILSPTDEPKTADGVSMGTPGYMAPEQLRAASSADQRADIFSLGAILYQLVTGIPAFPQVDPQARLMAAQGEDFVHPADLCDDLLPGVIEAILGCLKADPAERWQSVSELAAVLPPSPRPPALSDLPTELNRPQEGLRLSRSSVPECLDAFCGREPELGELADWARGEGRLLSVLGPGGIGKTRLVLQFAQDARWRFSGGVWFVDLTSASSETTMLRAVAQVLGIPLSPSGAAEQLGRVLGAMSEVLLVLDNLEQIAQEAAEVVSTWLTLSPQLRVIQTSRRRVPIQGEAVLSLGPLGTRSAQQALFVARAHSARPGLVISERDARAVEQIVEALEGIPLAIELAAARTAVMSPSEITRHLRRARLGPEAPSVSMDGLLASAGGARAERHLTMRACLSWSWSLLAEPERAALTQLAVFEGGFDSAAADAVLAVQTLPTFDLLQSLTQHSWIGLRSATGPESSSRFVLLELVRAFALEQLQDAQAVRTRHAAYFASFGTLDFHSKVCSQGGVEAYNELLLEIDNLAAATRSAAQTGADEVAVALLSAGDLLVDRGFRWAGWRQTIDTLHERAPEHAPHRPALCRMLGWDLMRQGDWRRSIELFTEGLGLAERSGAEAEALLSRIGLSYALRSGREMARAYAAVHPVPTHADRLGLHWIEVRAHMALAGLVPGDGDFKEGIKHLRSAVDLARRSGDLRGEVAATVNLATVLGTRAQHSDADILMEAALVRIRRLGRGRLEAEVMSFAGLRYLRRGDVDLAVEWLSQAAQMIVSMGHLDRQLLVRARLTRALAAQGKLKEASRLRAIVLSALQDAELSDSISVEIWVQLAHTAISTEEDRALRGAMAQVERILALHDADATMLVAEQELSMLRSAVGRSSVPLG